MLQRKHIQAAQDSIELALSELERYRTPLPDYYTKQYHLLSDTYNELHLLELQLNR